MLVTIVHTTAFGNVIVAVGIEIKSTCFKVTQARGDFNLGSTELQKPGQVFLLPFSRGQQQVEMRDIQMFSVSIYQKIRFFLDMTKTTHKKISN